MEREFIVLKKIFECTVGSKKLGPGQYHLLAHYTEMSAGIDENLAEEFAFLK